MLSYQHCYHAGNHADVLKHVVLGEILAAMQQKDAPLFMLDAFASRGTYNLDSPEALKNREFESGIGRIWPHRHDESMAACEMHPQEFDALRASFRSSRRLALHKRDAYEALGALLPPKEKRGLVLLDPSYEEKDEYRRIGRAVAAAYPHFRAGVYLIWYPLLPAGRQSELFRELRKAGLRKILRVELDGRGTFGTRDNPMQMQGSGMLIVNPPWHAMQAISNSLDWLKNRLCPSTERSSCNSCRCDWLVPE